MVVTIFWLKLKCQNGKFSSNISTRSLTLNSTSFNFPTPLNLLLLPCSTPGRIVRRTRRSSKRTHSIGSHQVNERRHSECRKLSFRENFIGYQSWVCEKYPLWARVDAWAVFQTSSEGLPLRCLKSGEGQARCGTRCELQHSSALWRSLWKSLVQHWFSALTHWKMKQNYWPSLRASTSIFLNS